MSDDMVAEDPKPSDYELWSFPPLDETVDDHALLELEPIIYEPAVDPGLAEVEALKQSLRDQNHLLSTLYQDMQKKLLETDAELVIKLSALIRKTVKRLIGKELEADPALLADTVAKTMQDMEEKHASELLLSPEDYKIWNDQGIKVEGLQLKEDPQLQKGDYKITTPNSEIISILEDRLKAIFG